MKTIPRFVVVGHPNKGKSSIVATLAADDSVAIGPEPGTTTVCREYPMRVNNICLYVLIDAPGFQRSRRALEWLSRETASPAGRPDAVKNFTNDPEAKIKCPDECEILRPIVEGAGILYVVDGSVPYGPEYLAELEILQWTGRPRMALINPIQSEEYVAEWKKALGQYFSVVRVFNPNKASFEKQVELLQAFGELEEAWKPEINEAIAALQKNRGQRLQLVAAEISQTIICMLEHRIEQQIVENQEDLPSIRRELELKFLNELRAMEYQLRKRVEELCEYFKLNREEPELEVLEPEFLFSEESWRLFGLSKTEVLTYSALGGSIVGGSVDAVTGGASLFAGAIIGGVVGVVTAALSAQQLVHAKLVSIPLGKNLLVLGPIKQLSFPHMVFNRARLHYYLLSRRTHAHRNVLYIGQEQNVSHEIPELSRGQKDELERIFSKTRSGGIFRSSSVDSLREVILSILRNDEKQSRN